MNFKNDIEKFEYFEWILSQRATEREKKQFEEALHQDVQLANEYDDYQQTHELILDGAILDTKQTLQSIHNGALKNPGKGNGLTNNQWIVSIITAILVTPTVLLFFQKDGRQADTNKQDVSVHQNRVVDSPQAVKTDTAFKEPKGYNPVTINNPEKRVAKPKQKEVAGKLPINTEADTSLYQPEMVEKDKSSLTDEQKKPKIPVNKQVLEQGPTVINENSVVENETLPRQLNDTSETAVDCGEVIIQCDYEIKHTCIEHVSGEIRIHKSTITGGSPPYFISINGGMDFMESTYVFSRLSSGTYQLVIQDNHQCVKDIGQIIIEEEICQTDYKYSPMYDEPWEIPFEKGKKGVFRVFSRTGQVVVEKHLDEYTEKTWTGKDDGGIPLEMGYYPFAITYDDGEVFQGSVTLVK